MVNPSVPELFGIPVAVLALGVAGAAFLVSGVSLIWQIVKHGLEGGRVHVYLNAASLEPDFRLSTNRAGRWEMRDDGKVLADHIELAQLVVENGGRAPVTIFNPGLAIAGHRLRGHSVVPRMFKLDGYGADSATTETYLRIEPSDRKTWLLDYWPIIPNAMETAGGRGIRLRGAVAVAGRRALVKSSFRRRWSIRPDSFTAFKGREKIAPRTILWRAIWRDNWPGGEEVSKEERNTRVPSSFIGAVVREGMSKFDSLPLPDDLQVALEDAAKKYGTASPILGMAVYNFYDEIERLGEHVGEWRPKARPVDDSDSPTSVDDLSTETDLSVSTPEPD